MGDILFIIAFLGLLLGPCIYFGIKKKKGFWYWTGTVSSMATCLGIGELVSKIFTEKTLSSNFWALDLVSPNEANVFIVCWILAWTLLMIHLKWKSIKKLWTKN